MLALAVGVVLLVVVLWLILPDSPVAVAVITLVVIGAAGFGLWRILSSGQFSREPERRPAQPPDPE